jgi:hypothetical protein
MPIYGKTYEQFGDDIKPDFQITFKNSSPRFFAYYIEKYEHLYFQAKELARIGKLNDEKLKILKAQGAKRAMARFMSTLPDDSEEEGKQT